MAKIYPVVLATMENCDYSHNVYDTDFGKKVRAGFLGFIVVDRDKMLVFDTGPNLEHWRDAAGAPLVEGDPSAAFLQKLRELGKTPEDIDYVVLSHLHSDHIGNWKMFPKAEIVILRQEMAYAAAPVNPLYYDLAEIAELIAASSRIRYVDADEDLTEHVRLMRLGGHTPGSMAALVQTAQGVAALAGDFVCVYENLHTRSVTVTNVDEWILSLRRLKSAADLILPGHELRVAEDYPVI